MADPVVAQSPGGSNLLAWQLGGNHGVIAEYDLARGSIRAMLRQMFADGQRRVRLPILHWSYPDNGLTLSSSGGDLSAPMKANLVALLADLRTEGFQELQVSMHPQWLFNGFMVQPGSIWSESAYQENWNLIVNLKPVFDACGISYRFDLLNEGIPQPGQALLFEYSRRLWIDYTSALDPHKLNTIGFSIIPDPLRTGMIAPTYSGNLPWLFDLHCGYQNTYSHFMQFDADLKSAGLNPCGLLVGEGFYNDPTSAADLARAVHDSGRTLFYALQWPVTRGAPPGTVQDVIPTEYAAYHAAGL